MKFYDPSPENLMTQRTNLLLYEPHTQAVLFDPKNEGILHKYKNGLGNCPFIAFRLKIGHWGVSKNLEHFC